ncbi:MAG TPA: TetR/AcrR family transcriptional regulator [Gaiellaceae bacterium]|jgi:AcrR family transcriptional regulator|nr:TetR/AcrR family transcriptional regulator [Gaiellaceae bacterium]
MSPDSTSPQRRGRPRTAAARRAIVDATLALLSERGFHGTTIEAIASRAGVGRNTIYRRWPTKEELVADALRELTADLDVREGDGLYSHLLAWVRDLTDLFADPLFSRILPAVLGEVQRNPVFARLYAERVVLPRRQALVDLLEDALERGELRQGVDVEQVADLLAGAPFLRLLPLGLPPIGERYAEELLATIWGGLEPRAPRSG